MDVPAESRAIADLMRRYLRQVGRRGVASSAITYGRPLDQLRRFLAARQVVEVDQLRAEDLEEWQDSYRARLQPKSRSLYATAARGWLRWMVERDYVPWRLTLAITSVRVPKAKKHPIPPDDLAVVLQELTRRPTRPTIGQLRDRALFFYALSTGARISELLQVLRSSYADQVVIQKGGTEKRLRVPPAVQAMVAEYLAVRRDAQPWLWVTHEPGKPSRLLSGTAANLAWKRIARRLKLKRWTNHRLRHSAASYLARQKMPAYVIADHLGHGDLRTVLGYIEVSEEARAEVLEAMERLAGEAPRPLLRRGVRLRGRPDRRPEALG